jgi:hypothetical protein
MRTKLISKTKLIPLVKDEGGFRLSAVSYEAYGRKVMAYLGLTFPEHRRPLEQFLIKHGLKVNTDYWPAGHVVEVQVSYFKAWHWDE